MGFRKWKQSFLELFRKEKAIGLVVALGVCGILLIYLSSLWGEPDESQEQTLSSEATSEEYKMALEADVKRIVEAITGEESPTVVITLGDNGHSLYASDERYNTQSSGEEGTSSEEERETTHVLLEDAQGNQSALTVTQTQPEVQGVVVVSRFAENPSIQEKLLNAVCTALDLSTAKVCVTSGG